MPNNSNAPDSTANPTANPNAQNTFIKDMTATRPNAVDSNHRTSNDTGNITDSSVIDTAISKDSLDKSLRLNPRGTEGLIIYSYVSPDTLPFFNANDTIDETQNDIDSNKDTDKLSSIQTPQSSLSLNYPYVYTSHFIIHSLANQVAQAAPEPEIAIATCNPETLEEEEIPYVTSDSVVPALDSNDGVKNKSDAQVTHNAYSLSNGNQASDQASDQIVDNDHLLKNSTPTGIDETNKTHKADNIANTNTNDNLPSDSNMPDVDNKDGGQSLRDDILSTTSKTEEERTVFDNLVKKQRPKDEEEIQAEKESKLESYKQFVAKQESKVEIDYPAIRVSIEANALPSRMYFIMNALSAVIASYGLVMNSAAVVIGAMLVAMMLGPISGSALAIIDYRIPFLRKSIATVVAGAGMVLFIGYVIGSIHEGRPLTNEILSRTQPTSMDLMVALAGGTAGAYAMISPHLSVAVVGVAVATALVPPLAASGILFANGEMSLGFGALLLAFTNIIAIQFTNGLVLWFAGFRRLMSEDYKKNTHLAFFRRNAVPLVLLTGIGIYLSYNLNNIATRQSFENAVTQVVEGYFIPKDNMLEATQFINKEDHLTIRAVITGQTRPNSSDVKYLEREIMSRMSESTPDLPDIQLQLRYIPVVVIESTPRPDEKFGKTDAAILSTEQ